MTATSPLASSSPEDSSQPLYQRVADRIADLIASGTLRPGQRVPSVRKLSQQMSVSVTTVLQAYRLLEDRKLIEAKPQSGYYVRGQYWQRPAEPAISSPPIQSTSVGVSDLIMRILHTGQREDVVNLGSGLSGPELLPTAHLHRLLAGLSRRTTKSANHYDVPPGCEALRVQIARRAIEAGCALRPDEIVTTSGSTEAITLCLRAATRPGDTVAVESPTYYGILSIIEMLGLRALEIPTCPREGISINALRFALEQHDVKAVVVVPNFNNPLGSRMTDSDMQEMVAMCEQHGATLIEDDIFGDLGFNNGRPRACKSYDRTGNVMMCSSFSKTLSPGFRVGYCAPGKHLRQFIYLKYASSLATSTLPQLAVAEFLSSGGYDHHLRRVRKLYAEQVEQMSRAVGAYFPSSTRITRPQGGFLLWVEMPEQVDALTLHDRALEHGISIVPGPIFSAKQKYRHFVRLNCGYRWSDRMEQAVETLGRLVKQMC